LFNRFFKLKWLRNDPLKKRKKCFFHQDFFIASKSLTNLSAEKKNLCREGVRCDCSFEIEEKNSPINRFSTLSRELVFSAFPTIFWTHFQYFQMLTQSRFVTFWGKDDNFECGYFETGRVTPGAPGRARVGDGEVRLG